MSYLEEWFYDNVIIKYNLASKYDIINELSIYPYFIDFAFSNIKIAVELDGTFHLAEKQIHRDNKKDAFLLENGWSVFRIRYDEANETKINEFLNFLYSYDSKPKLLANKVERIKRPKKEKRIHSITWFNRIQKQRIELVINSNIDFSKKTWRVELAKLLNINSQHSTRWLRKFIPCWYKNYARKYSRHIELY
ncbi:DUF559 domain-containing protein [Candidatus Pacearchaeota archaeon]|nr:DUF559 domain-containing protein [Candidatus Pacearchaeota archaeon]